MARKKLTSRQTQKTSEHATGDTNDDATRNDAQDIEEGREQDTEGRLAILDPNQAEKKLLNRKISSKERSEDAAAQENESKTGEARNKNSKSAEKVGKTDGRRGQSNEKYRSKEGTKRKQIVEGHFKSNSIDYNRVINRANVHLFKEHLD